MAGGPLHKAPHSRHKDSPADDEWYAVTGGGGSAVKIAPGLVVGESETGALALNDPEPANQWVEFLLNDTGEPWATLITRERSLLVDGVTRMRHPLTAGTTVQLPHNTLYISRDSHMPAQSGEVIEVVAREVPGRPQDLVGPGWAEALAAVQEPGPGSGPTEPLEPNVPHEPSRTFGAHEPAHADRLAQPPTSPEGAPAAPPAPPERAYRGIYSKPRTGGRRGQRGRRILVTLGVLGLGAMTVAAVVAMLLSAGSGPADRAGDAEGPTLDDPAATVEPQLPSPSEPALEVEDRATAPASAASARDGGRVDLPPPETPVSAREDAEVEAMPPPDTVVGTGLPAQAPAAEADAPAAQRESAPASPETVAPPPVATLPATEAGEDPPEVAPGNDPSAATPGAGSPDWRLVRARELLDAGYITYPPRDNAVAYLERLLAVQPNHPEALALLEACANELIDSALRAHDQGLDYEARNTLEEVLGFDPGNEQANRLWREWVTASR